MKKKYLYQLIKTILCLSFMSQISNAQITFLKTYSGLAAQGNSLVQTSDSGFVIFGYTEANQPILIKTDKFGDTVWTWKYDIPQQYRSKYTLTKTLENGYILGYSNVLIKTDINGNQIWRKNYDSVYISKIESAIDSGFVFTGATYKDNWGYVYLVKVDNLGVKKWIKIYDDSHGAFVAGNYIQETKDRGYIITGFTLLQDEYLYVIKTDSNGNILWSKKYGAFYTEGNSVVQTTDGGYFITGHYTIKPCEYCELFYHTWLLKLNSEGDTIWTKKYIFDFEDQSRVGKQTTDGGYIITGVKYTVDLKNHLFVAKLNELGDTLWTKTLTDELPGDTEGYDIVETYDGGYAVAGSVTYYNGQSDMLLLKLDKDGEITAVDSKEKNLLPKEFSLYQNYPNPFNPSTTISYQLPKNGFVTLKIYDVLGREVSTLVNEYKSAGNYTLNFDASNLSSGVYIYTICSADNVLSKKMILLR